MTVSHPEQTAFIKLVAKSNADRVAGAKVLEVGSYDVYGTFRSFFSTAGEYVGIDLGAGPGVDLVLSSHDLVGQLSGFDLVVSGEALEHDTNWRLSVRNMVEVLVSGGMVVITCAGSGRPEHGTTRTNPEESPGTQSLGWDHYENVSIAEFQLLMKTVVGVDYLVWENPRVFDLYAVIVKSEQAHGWVLPTDFEVAKIIRSTPFIYQAARWPIRAAIAVGGITRGETFGRHWWKLLSSKLSNGVRGSQVS
jgi:SAM-dependent methyltransferase